MTIGFTNSPKGFVFVTRGRIHLRRATIRSHVNGWRMWADEKPIRLIARLPIHWLMIGGQASSSTFALVRLVRRRRTRSPSRVNEVRRGTRTGLLGMTVA